ncbi:MAG: PaaI family thioesterase [Anaerolineales bacterium]|nr:PaaI family thioesterase [Anaerolineales bacterium]
MKKLPNHGICFVCGSDNPHGIGLTWYADGKGIITSNFCLGEAQQGPPGYAHGGASAAILDEAMGAAVWLAGYNVAVVNLQLNYRHPLPLGQQLTLTARLTRRSTRKIFARGQICLPDGTVAVSGHGIYVTAPNLFEPVRFRERF